MKGSALTNGFCFSFHVLIGFSRTVFSLVYEDVFGFVWLNKAQIAELGDVLC